MHREAPTTRLHGCWRKKLNEIEHQPFIVENKPGGGSNIGADYVVKAPADGYTLLIVATSHAINMTLFPKEQQKYDLLKDLAPISMIMTGPLVLVTRPDFPAHNSRNWLPRPRPSRANCHSPRRHRSSTHLGGEMLNSAAGIKTIHVPYRGSGARVDRRDGWPDNVHDRHDDLGGPLRDLGQLKALAVTGKSRSPRCRRCRPSPSRAIRTSKP